MEATGYLYKTTWTPEGLMYFGSRKLPEGVTPDEDEYMGTPCGTNKMLELFNTRPQSEFVKEVLTAGEYRDIIELETLLIVESWDKFGKAHEGGKVCNLAAAGGYIQTDETRAKISNSLKGGTHRAESKAKMSEARMGKSPWNKGLKGGTYSAEHRANIAASLKGKPKSEEHRANMTAAWIKRREKI